MIGKVAIFAALVAFVNAGIPVGIGYDHIPEYSYNYAVSDPWTGDHKSQVESRSGDFVKGQYSLVDSDGTQRVVDYAAGPVTGFNAVVSKHPIAAPVAAAPVAAVPVAAHALPYTYGAYPYAFPHGGYYGSWAHPYAKYW